MKYKHPKTYHLDFSHSVHSDDKIKKDNNSLKNQEIVATLKYDGENTSLYSDYIHARSLDSSSNWTRDFSKNIHSQIKHLIPQDWRLVCENLFAKHSIYYPPGYLDGYLYLLFVFDDKNNTLHYDEELKFAKSLNLPTPKVLYRGPYDYNKLKKLSSTLDTSIEEGFVVRKVEPFAYSDFALFTEKFVRKNHVNDKDVHWLKTAIQNGTPKTNQTKFKP